MQKIVYHAEGTTSTRVWGWKRDPSPSKNTKEVNIYRNMGGGKKDRCRGCLANTWNLKQLNRLIIFSSVISHTIPGCLAPNLFLTLLLEQLPLHTLLKTWWWYLHVCPVSGDSSVSSVGGLLSCFKTTSHCNPLWTSRLGSWRLSSSVCLDLSHNLLFFSLVLRLFTMMPISFLLVCFHLFLQDQVHKWSVTFSTSFFWFIPPYLDHWAPQPTQSVWCHFFLPSLCHLKMHCLKVPPLFQIKLFRIIFFLPRKKLALLPALLCVYVTLARAFTWQRFSFPVHSPVSSPVWL